MAGVITEPKVIGMAANRRIIFDFDGAAYRGAYYYQERDADGKNRRKRASCHADSLEGLLLGLFNIPRYDDRARDVERYIRSTDWGSDLP